MTRLHLAKDPKAALKGADVVLLVAPRGALAADRLFALLPEPARARLKELAAEARPGDGGQITSTLTGASPKKVLLGALPETLSRYNSPARPEPIYKVVSGAGLAKEKKAAILVVVDEPAHALPALNAVGRAFPLFSMKSEAEAQGKVEIAVVSRDGAAVAVPKEAAEVMNASREIAALVDRPPTDLGPETLAKEVRRLLAGLKNVTVKEIAGDALKRAGLGGLHAVGRTAVQAPRMLVASYKPARKKGAHVALVGKGITFDTGGLHIKPRGGMETMKADMGGAAAVAGAFRALVTSGTSRPLSLVLCLAENAVGPTSYKPDDILTLHSGKTVEINNTDAEGRLLLADGVSWAARELGAEVIFDAATLTGAQMIATGLLHAAVISNDEELEQLLVRSGKASGDLVHPLPFAPELFKGEFKSPVADMRNSVKNRNNAQSSCAAQFVYNHLEGVAVRWAHIDLAGPAFRGDRGTGFGVALLFEAVKNLG